MEVIKVLKQKEGYKVTTDNNKEHFVSYIKGTFLYKETKNFIDGGGEIEPEYTDEELLNIEKEKTKQAKEIELKELTIDINAVFYDAHQEAIGNMATVVAVATATFQKAISVGIIKAGETEPTVMTPAQAYQYVYKDKKVTWKGADNKPHNVQIESLVEASEKAMTAKAVILFKY